MEGLRVRTTDCVKLPSDAVSDAVWVVTGISDVCDTPKSAEADPAGTLTAAGNDNAVLVVESATVLPPLGAVCERVTVQLVLRFGASIVAPHCSEESVTGADSENTTRCDELPIVAVRFAV